MALDLADFDTALRGVIADSVTVDSSLVASDQCNKLFTHLIQQPVEKISADGKLLAIGPILIVIDALDESGTAAEREKLLAVLSNELPEKDIKTLSLSRQFRSLDMDDAILQSDIHHDITTFISTEFEGGFKNDGEYVYYSRYIGRLVDKAEGLFQWASVACKLCTAQDATRIPTVIIEDILSLHSTSLDTLYSKALEPFTKSPDLSRSGFRHIMSLVLSAFEPLTMQTLSEMYHLAIPEKESSVRLQRTQINIPASENPVNRVLRLMGALLSGVHADNVRIRPLHTSFRDFLLDSERSRDLHVSCDQAHRDFAISTLRYMNKPDKLFFNMCGLETSYRRNRDIPDLRDRVDRALDQSVSYSSRFWAKHLEKVPTDAFFSAPLKRWIDEKLLFWFEALSLLDAFEAGPASLSIALKWIKDNLPWDKSSIGMLEDALHFCRVFARCIVQSAPHLYLSALQLCPDHSLIKQHYLPLFPSILRFYSGTMVSLPRQEMSIVVDDIPNAVAMSSDGTRIAAGLSDNTVRVWNAETGEQVCPVLKGHVGLVTAVALSADGTRLVSGSSKPFFFNINLKFMALCIWNADTGEQIGAALDGHSDTVTSVAISADGKRVVSGSYDSTSTAIRIWNADTGEQVTTAPKGHSDKVTSVALSADGKRVISGSDDCSVCIWNADTGEQVGAALKGHSGRVTSVALSANGKRAVSGSRDFTIRIWNLDTDKEVGVALEGHSNAVASVALSADGMCVVSASHDKTMRIWNADTGEQIGAALEGHSDPVTSVAISADGKRAVSGAHDRTVRIWNTEMSEQVGGPPQVRSGMFTSAALSADGKRLACGFDDHTVRIWNVDTGEQFGTALEGHPVLVTSVAFSVDGRCVVSGSLTDTTVRIWDADLGEQVATLEGHLDGVESLALSSDGHRIISVSRNGTVRLWNPETYEQVGPALDGGRGPVSVALSADEERVVSASSYGTVHILNTDTGEQIGNTLEGPRGFTPTRVAISADGTRVVYRDHATVHLLNVTTGERIETAYYGHRGWDTAVALSPDGKYFLSKPTRDDRTVRIWDTDTGKQVGSALEGHSKSRLVNSVAFSGDGKRVISLSDDQVRVWNVDMGKQAEERGVLGFCSDRQSHGLQRLDLLTGGVPVTYPPGSDLRDMVRLDDDGWIVYNNGTL
ncbi:quinon protein alcohol dehydrogenase-like superfamily [Mycena capillaripes]|nr:quinon protein alcohol dehydrogenase-like superfamily [Mycena capillaripes]